ncbi:MAG TPA: hypothetical protein VL490_04845 [Mucilaginibacter sp.]|jgi:hypothetical protein|nr:hypothetical protein [Mucilaginibacter sp.]
MRIFGKNDVPVLKRSKANIFYAWLLLICFIAGQGVVYAHQHKITAGNGTKTYRPANAQAGTTIQEKCALCDAMHHTNAVMSTYAYVSPNIVTKHFYRVYNYDFISIALVLSAGRAPPVSAFC